jgi:hypothetical protein
MTGAAASVLSGLAQILTCLTALFLLTGLSPGDLFDWEMSTHFSPPCWLRFQQGPFWVPGAVARVVQLILSEPA